MDKSKKTARAEMRDSEAYIQALGIVASDLGLSKAQLFRQAIDAQFPQVRRMAKELAKKK